MKKRVYAIRDNLSFDFEAPVVYSTDLDCLRSLSTQVSSEIIKFEKGQIDFDPKLQHASRSLYAIGYYYPASGSIEGFTPELVCVVSDAPNLYKKMMVEFHPNSTIDDN